LLNAEISGLRHTDVSPRQVALLALTGSPEAEASGASFGILCGQSKSALHAGIAFETHHKGFARALAIRVTGY